MLDGIPLDLGDLGATGILAAVVFMILTGRLVPRKVLEDVRADRDARLAEAAYWHTAFQTSQNQIDVLIGRADVSTKAVLAMRAAVEGGDQT